MLRTPEGTVPETHDDLRALDAAGLLVEGPRVEFKAALEPGNGANAEMARDLAALAISGGLLMVGITDEKHRPPTFAPVRLTGLAERIEHIAHMRIDPPLLIRVRVLPSTDDPSVGFVVVAVPVSSEAPHQVDGIYYGRGEREKRRLGDNEVERLMSFRRRLSTDATAELDAYEARDPLTRHHSTHGRLLLVATPRGTEPTALLRTIEGQRQLAILDLVQKVQTRGERGADRNGFAPTLSSGAFGSRSDGWAMATFDRRALEADFGTIKALEQAHNMIEVEITEAGTARIYCARATDRMGDQWFVMETLIAGLTRNLVDLSAEIGTRVGFWGRWSLGLRLSSLRSSAGFTSSRGNGTRSVTHFSGDRYQQTATATTAEMVDRGGKVASALVGRFLRSMNVESDPGIHGWIPD